VGIQAGSVLLSHREKMLVRLDGLAKFVANEVSNMRAEL
jgi:hypothetical protein